MGYVTEMVELTVNYNVIEVDKRTWELEWDWHFRNWILFILENKKENSLFDSEEEKICYFPLLILQGLQGLH